MQNAEKDLSERTFRFARRVICLYSALGSDVIPQTLGRQLLRSGTSVGANYREAERSRSKKEFTSTMGLCLRELNETHYWLELLKAESVFDTKRIEPLINETSELIAIFTTIIKKSLS